MPLLFALFLSQIIHELGHLAVAALYVLSRAGQDRAAHLVWDVGIPLRNQPRDSSFETRSRAVCLPSLCRCRLAFLDQSCRTVSPPETLLERCPFGNALIPVSQQDSTENRSCRAVSQLFDIHRFTAVPAYGRPQAFLRRCGVPGSVCDTY